MITPHILVISTFLSVTWGIYLGWCIKEYWSAKAVPPARRPKGELIVAFRRMLTALCVWLICFAYVFRTICVLLGVGDAVIAQITFFALLGTNVVGSLFAVASLRYD